MFTPADLVEIRDRSINILNSYPVRCRLEGMTRDLDESEKRVMAMYEASMVVGLKKVNPDAIRREWFPKFHTAVNETVEGESAVYNADARGAVRK